MEVVTLLASLEEGSSSEDSSDEAFALRWGWGGGLGWGWQ
jgi:hypothetical protein